jgi:hypothetical protein
MPHPDAEFAAQEANKAAALRLYEEVINREQKPTIDEIFAADVLVHDPFTGAHREVFTARRLSAATGHTHRR